MIKMGNAASEARRAAMDSKNAFDKREMDTLKSTVRRRRRRMLFYFYLLRVCSIG